MHALVLMVALAQSPEVESMKAFRGPEGQLVELVALKPRASSSALSRARS